jgi:mono/diheme cytochrome c family protein
MIFFLPASCSQFNSDSREHYIEANSFRHGSMEDISDVEFAATQVEPISEESARRGKSLYNKYCISCHGPSGKGDGPKGKLLKKTPKNLAQLAQRVKKLRFYMVKSHEEGKMPGWKPFFSNKNLVDIESYIRTFISKEKG